MNIALYVSEADQVGGAELATLRLAERLSQRGCSVTVLTTVGLRRWLHHFVIIDYAKGFRLIRLPVWQRNERTFRAMLLTQAAWTIPALMRRTQVLHARGLTVETIRLAQLARRMGIRTLCTPMASGDYGDMAKLPARARRYITVFDRIAALTEPLRAEIVSIGYPPDRIRVIPNGVDADCFKPAAQPHNQPRAVFVGQFRPEKRVDLLLRAWQNVAAGYPQARLTLVGGGRLLADYQRMASGMGVSATFVPNTDTVGVRVELHEASIFVAPGISEGMSNALLEAMAVGLAPIAADTPASRAIITPECDGLVYAPESPEALAAQLVRLIDDDALRQRLGQAAHDTILRRFTLDQVVDQHLAMYCELLGEPSNGTE